MTAWRAPSAASTRSGRRHPTWRRATARRAPAVTRLADGDTTHLCALDADGLGISLTQSNALDFGSHLIEPATGVFLHNRGVGLLPRRRAPRRGRPGRRPPHTLSPMLVTAAGGALTHLVGAMGGDAQPQIIVQLLARLLHAGQDPATAIAAPRLTLDAPSAGPFRLWWGDDLTVLVESDAPPAWAGGLAGRGHRVRTIGAFDPVAVGLRPDHRGAARRRGGPPTRGGVGPEEPRGRRDRPLAASPAARTDDGTDGSVHGSHVTPPRLATSPPGPTSPGARRARPDTTCPRPRDPARRGPAADRLAGQAGPARRVAAPRGRPARAPGRGVRDEPVLPPRRGRGRDAGPRHRAARAPSSRSAPRARRTSCARRWPGGPTPGCTSATRPSRAPTRWPPPGPWRQRSAMPAPSTSSCSAATPSTARRGRSGPRWPSCSTSPSRSGVRGSRTSAPSCASSSSTTTARRRSRSRCRPCSRSPSACATPARWTPRAGRPSPADRHHPDRPPSELGPGPWGEAGSPTVVGAARPMEHARARADAARARSSTGAGGGARAHPARRAGRAGRRDAASASGVGTDGSRRGTRWGTPPTAVIAVLVEPGRPEVAARAARRARRASARGAAPRSTPCAPGDDEVELAGRRRRGPRGLLDGSRVAEDVADAVVAYVRADGPLGRCSPPARPSGGRSPGAPRRPPARAWWATRSPCRRATAALVAAKPAFAGALVADITCRSATQMVTVRPGVLPAPPRLRRAATRRVDAPGRRRRGAASGCSPSAATTTSRRWPGPRW